MIDPSTDIAALVRTVVEPLVEFPEDLNITSVYGQDDELIVEIRSHEEDAGKIIGRQGRVIKSIRTLARAAASRVNIQVEVELVD